jgi:hypothetical protein
VSLNYNKRNLIAMMPLARLTLLARLALLKQRWIGRNFAIELGILMMIEPESACSL